MPLIRKIARAPRFQRHIKKAVNPIAEAVARGIVVDTDEVIADTLADGRVRLRLHPNVRARIAAGGGGGGRGGPGGPYGGNIFLV